MTAEDVKTILDKYKQTASSGSLLLAFKGAGIGQIYLSSGTIQSARFKGQEGRSALDAMIPMNAVNHQFHAGVDTVRSSSPVATPAPVPREVLSSSSRQAIMEILAEYVGPAAMVLVKSLPADIEPIAALNTLSQQISESADASAFMSRSMSVL